MDINVKAEYVKQHIRNIVTDDDAPIEAVAAVMQGLSEFILTASHELIERRAALAAIAADDVGTP